MSAFEQSVVDGWICWAFSNHDVVRHVSRWARPGADTDSVAKFAIDLLVSLRGSICLYQGEELGLEEADIAFEDLRDPYGIRFWPAFKGRDGCRTPMVWESGAAECRLHDRQAVAAGARGASPPCGRPRARRPRLGARALSPGAGVPPSAPGAGCRHDRIPRRRWRCAGVCPRYWRASGCFASSTLPATRPNGSSRPSWVSRKSSKGWGVVRASRARSSRSTHYRPASRGSARRGRMLRAPDQFSFVPASAVTVS